MDIKKIAVLGSGTMGHGIAQAAAFAGYEVSLYDIAQDLVDKAMKLGAGHPMGPCELADFGGFDVIQMACDQVFEYTHRESDRLNILYQKMIEAGRLGRKNGKGFYDYLPDGTKKPFQIF